MLTRRRFSIAVLALTIGFAGTARAQSPRATTDIPSALNDQEFWSLTETLSEPNGFFRSDNFLSNERGYQLVIPGMVETIKPGGVYLGVGPEQNFPYIVALKPRMVFIIDIRRGNLREHLLYKAIFEMSATRADFLSRLFSRKRPDGLTAASTITELFAAYDGVQASEALYKENLDAIVDWLTKKHRFVLSDEDLQGLAYIYHDAFFIGGPNLNYAMGGGGGGNSPTYRELMLTTDGNGQNRGYLSSEESFAFLKDLETKNLLVPIVGNFGGPKAIRAVGQYVKDHDAMVVAFYLSNVEQYLSQDGIWGNFCSSVATLPLDDTSTFIYSGRGGPNSGGMGGGGGLSTSTRPILEEAKGCATGGPR